MVIDNNRGPEEAESLSWLSIIIPVLNEATVISQCLHELQLVRGLGGEVIVVDGGSTDDTRERLAAEHSADQVVQSSRGRAIQMNAGARISRGSWLLFLHSDTRLSQQALSALRELYVRECGAECWGRFDVSIEGSHPFLRVVAFCMNLRSRITGIATGDQAMFVSRPLFDGVGGFPEQALMEDIALSSRLRRRARPQCMRSKVSTSGRRWEKQGVLRTILLMWRLRLFYYLGVSPESLARQYDRGPLGVVGAQNNRDK